MHLLIQIAIIIIAIIQCIGAIMFVRKYKRFVPSGGLPLQQIQAIYNPDVENLMVYQHKDEREEKESGEDL